MKKSLFAISLFVLSQSAIAGDPNCTKRVAQVDASDTVVFDLSQIVINGNSMMFPVSFLSDDSIYAVDFSLKFDESKLTYDSIVNHKTYLSPVSYFNTTDRTLRFTSSSLQQIENKTALVSIAFTSAAGIMAKGDLNTIKAYLNGDKCSIKVMDTLHVNVDEFGNEMPVCYPNPITDVLVIRINKFIEDASLRIYDITGTLVKEKHISGNLFSISCKDFSHGVYFYRIESFSGKFLKE